jgi:hypothetical protein
MSGPTVAQLLATARALLVIDTPQSNVRAAAVLTRNALEQMVDEFWIAKGLTAMVQVNRTNQLICLPAYLSAETRTAAAGVTQAWSVLSGLVHFHPYELVILPSELIPIIRRVESLSQLLATAPA